MHDKARRKTRKSPNVDYSFKPWALLLVYSNWFKGLPAKFYYTANITFLFASFLSFNTAISSCKSCKKNLSTSSLISSSFQCGSTIFHKGIFLHQTLHIKIYVLWGSCNIPHTPLCCLKERAQALQICFSLFHTLFDLACPIGWPYYQPLAAPRAVKHPTKRAG